MKRYYPGNIVEVKVVGIKPYGVFVNIDDKTMGLIHISEISEGYVDDINKFVKIGEILRTKILDIDYNENKAKLSLKAMKKRERYRKNKCSLSEERIQVEKEFFPIKIRMEDFVLDAKERLGMQND